jgi:nucleoside-diphosphate kinase
LKERTLAILKPDCVQKDLIGKVISKLEEKGFKIVAMKMIMLDKKTAGEFYAIHKERSFFGELLDYMTSDRCVPMVVEHDNAVSYLREVMGATDPKKADNGTIRKEYGESIQYNIIHGSDSTENAKREIAFFFSENELIGNIK